MKTKGAGATRDVESRLKIYGSSGTSLFLWVRRLCAEAQAGLWHIPIHAEVAPCSSAQIPEHDPPCRPQVQVEGLEVLLSVVSPARCLGKSFRTFCLQKQPRDTCCSPKQEGHLDPLSSTYNMLVFLLCLVYLHVRNVHFDKEIINKDHISCKAVVFQGDLNSVGTLPLNSSEYQL